MEIPTTATGSYTGMFVDPAVYTDFERIYRPPHVRATLLAPQASSVWISFSLVRVSAANVGDVLVPRNVLQNVT